MGHYLDDAKTLYKQALLELEQWRKSQDEVLLRDAAEKAWGAMVQAANELLHFHGVEVPFVAKQSWIELYHLERRNRELHALWMEARLSEAELILHKECFEDGVFQVNLVVDEVEEVQEYLDDVAQLTNGQGR